MDEDRYIYISPFTLKLCRAYGISLQLSRDAGLNKSCAFKEFRFPPPYGGKKKDRQRKKLPPIPENMLPKRHNSFEEVDLEEYVRLPAISPAMTSEEKVWHQVDPHKLSVLSLSTYGNILLRMVMGGQEGP